MVTRRVRVSLLGITVTVAAIGVAPGGVAVGAEEGPTPTDIDHAVHFRGSVGFRDGRGFVERTYVDTSDFPDDSWGIPLSREEAADLKARLEVQLSLGDAQEYAMSRDTFAGVYLDQLRGGLPVFQFVGDAGRFRDDIAERLDRGTDFEVREVQRSWSELTQVQSRIDAADADLEKDGIHVVRTSIDTSGNRVVVGVQGLTDARGSRLKERFGNAIVTIEDGPARADYCDDTFNCWPPMGGHIVKVLGSNESVAYAKGSSTPQSRTIKKTIELDFDSTGGDSGGPVFSDLTESVGYGLHVHSDVDDDPIPPGQDTRRSWYTPLDAARATLIDRRGVSITWCTTSTC